MDKIFSIRLEQQMQDALNAWARENDRSTAWLIRNILADALIVSGRAPGPLSVAVHFGGDDGADEAEAV